MNIHLSSAPGTKYPTPDDPTDVPPGKPKVPAPPPSFGLFGGRDGVEMARDSATTTVTCPAGTEPVVTTSGQTVTVTCEPELMDYPGSSAGNGPKK